MKSLTIGRNERGFALDGLVAVGICPMAKHLSDDVGRPFARLAEQEAVAKEVEAEFVGRAVGDVAGVRFAALVLRLL